MEKKAEVFVYGNGSFGNWVLDEFNLPAYEYTCIQTLNPIAKTNTSGKDSIDHWHQVGNDRITLTAHNGGYMQYFIADRGLEWLSYHDLEHDSMGGGICLIEHDKKIWSDLFNSKLNSKEYKRIFGCGYFKKIIKKDDIEIEHFLFPPFGDEPVVLSEILIKNNSNKTITLDVYEFWGIRIRYLIGSILSMLYMPKDRVKFGETRLVSFVLRIIKNLLLFLHISSEQVRNRFSNKFEFKSHFSESDNCLILTPKYKGRIPVKKNQPADKNYFHNPIFLKSYETDSAIKYFNIFKIQKRNSSLYYVKKEYKSIIGPNPCLMLGHEISLKPKESKSLKFIFGTAEKEKIPGLITKYEKFMKKEFLDENFGLWKDFSMKLNLDSKKWLSREVEWHSYYLRSASLFDNYYNNHYLPQGSAYGFLHGANGAVRDYVLFLISMIYLNADLAREMIEFILRTMSPEGLLPYATMGFGKNMGAFVHETSSDLHLFLLWALIEYIYITRDFQFLDKKIPFYPLDSKKSSTVLERIVMSLKFTFNNVGLGEHGLIRVGSGDWSDGISLFAKNRGAFLKKGESTFNSAMALYLIPHLINLLKKSHPKITKYLDRKYQNLKKAVLKTWNGRWFYRGYDGMGNPIGDENLFLEHHVWIILAGIMSKKQEQILIKNIYNLLDTKSKIGQYILFPPAKVLLNVLPQGWDVNGGIWFAMNFLLTWAYSKVDKKKAFQSLIKNSMARRAEIYPNIWYGIWSGPDSYNAEYASNPGQTFIHPATPQTDFPIMNLNIHANFLNSVLKLAGITPTFEGLIIDPKFPTDSFEFESKLLKLKVSSLNIHGFYKPLEKYECIIKIRKPQG